METQELKQNIKLGAFVLLGLLLFAVALFYIGKENTFFNRTFTISAVFRNIEGLKEGDTVVTSGQLKLKNGSAITINNSVVPTNNPAPVVVDQ